MIPAAHQNHNGACPRLPAAARELDLEGVYHGVYCHRRLGVSVGARWTSDKPPHAGSDLPATADAKARPGMEYAGGPTRRLGDSESDDPLGRVTDPARRSITSHIWAGHDNLSSAAEPGVSVLVRHYY